MPEPVSEASAKTTPDYVGLVKFLVEPFLEQPESLRVDCEVSPGRSKVWVRLAFEGSDKGRVFGRGGRNIQAIRSVLEAAARAAGYSAHLDIYGSQTQGRNGAGDADTPTDEKSTPRRPPSSKALPKLRSRDTPPEDPS